MIDVTGRAQLDAWRDHVMPPVEKVREGLWSVPVPLPSVLRYVLVYVLETPDGIAVIDAGWGTDEAWQAFRAGLAQIGHSVGDVGAILITHAHMDHYGLAGRVREESGAWIGMHEQEAAHLPRRRGDADSIVAGIRRWLVACGVPADEVDELAGAPERVQTLLSLPEPDVLLRHGERVDVRGWDLYPVWTPGHTPGHLCFHDTTNDVFFSGDHVLPRISPNISAFVSGLANPLAAFLDSLSAVAGFTSAEVLPAHEYRFRGLADRSEDLRRHHDARLAEVLDVVRSDPGLTTFAAAARLTWSRDWSQNRGFVRRSAIGETLAHLVLLEHRGVLSRVSTMPDRWLAKGAAETALTPAAAETALAPAAAETDLAPAVTARTPAVDER